MFPTLQVGPLSIQVPGLLLLAGLWIGLSLSERQAKHSGIKPNQVYDLVFVALVAGIAGARLAYVLRYPQAFIPSPLSIFSLNPGLLDPFSGIVFAIFAGLVYGQRKGLPLLPTLDALAPGMAVLLVAVGLSHLAYGSAFGTETSLPWGFEIWGARRHPTQVYETMAAAAIVAAVWPGHGILPALFQLVPGSRFLVFGALSAAARLFLEAFRGDSQLLTGGWRAAQVAAWMLLFVSLWGLWQLLKKQSTRQEAASVQGE